MFITCTSVFFPLRKQRYKHVYTWTTVSVTQECYSLTKELTKTNVTPKILYTRTFHWGVEGSVNEKFQTSHQSRR